jgi:nitrate reductase gamma subunit
VSAFAFFVGVVLPPVAVLAFLLAMLYRIWAWKKLPQPFMTLFPAPKGGLWKEVLKETLLFPSLFEGDKALWLLAWVFHVMLAFIFVGHVRVFMDFPALWAALGINADTMSAVAGGAAGVAILAMALLLFLRRFTIRRVREITTPGDHFALLLILAILLTGNAMRFLGHFDLNLTRDYFAALVTFRDPSPPLNGWFLAHFLLAQVLILYIPFSKILHFGGVFFTQAALKRS